MERVGSFGDGRGITLDLDKLSDYEGRIGLVCWEVGTVERDNIDVYQGGWYS